MCDALRMHPDTANWYTERGVADGCRELNRIWDKTNPANGNLILSRSKPLQSARQFGIPKIYAG